MSRIGKKAVSVPKGVTASVSGQKVWVSQVEDYEVAFIAVANNSKVREAIDTAIKAMVRGGVHEIPGVRIWSDVKASNR